MCARELSCFHQAASWRRAYKRRAGSQIAPATRACTWAGGPRRPGARCLPAPCPGKAGDRRELAEEGWPDGRGEVREVAEGARDPGAEDGRPGVEAAHRLQDTELELEAVIWAGAMTTWCPSKSDQSSLSRSGPQRRPGPTASVPGPGVSTISWKVSMPSRRAKSAVAVALAAVSVSSPATNMPCTTMPWSWKAPTDRLISRARRWRLPICASLVGDRLDADHHHLAARLAHQGEELMVDLGTDSEHRRHRRGPCAAQFGMRPAAHIERRSSVVRALLTTKLSS